GTLARMLAAHYGLHHLDTGLTYRAVAKALIDAGEPLTDEAEAEAAARALATGSGPTDAPAKGPARG
ncbi:MAG: (d)CMP kinase, partial [Maritimibacter sp.]|nr:(d)CMP kinase [Maritimibacter sp.]